ncbi:TPA: tyrosine-type recombinase/integrase [Streptococcus mutans]|uniref:tyrosine-type recombinase/integrase n=1 Tax=Streptococcus mutans TaxID=1309 RepID=UPI001454E5B0|nr:site-specific integrase [Streptococcus mutans]NLQ71400.1 site-specific integrase [Streptococcus mutans]
MSIHKYKTKKGDRYFVKIYMTLDGQRRDHLKRGFKTRREAKRYENAINHKMNTGAFIAPQRASKELYREIFEKWFKSYQGTVEATTASRTLDIFRLHILPAFGDNQIKKISPLDCQDFITEKAETFRNIKQIKSYTSKVFDFAIKMRLLKHNPMAEIILPRRRHASAENFWSVQELQEFLSIVLKEEPYKHYVLFRLLAYSGLRKGELYALRWADINFDSETLSINKSLGRIKGKAIEKRTKNEFSVRKIKLDTETLAILYKWKQQSQKEKAQLSVTPLSIEQDYLFTYRTQAGAVEPLHADYINNILNRIVRHHHLKKISPHGFRHTHATLMTEIGIDPVNTAKRLGHASSQMTLDTYSHVTRAGEDKSINHFADYLKSN